MAQYDYSSIDFERFEYKTPLRGSAAPKYNPQPKKKEHLHLVEKPKNLRMQIRREDLQSRKKTFKILGVAILLLAVFSFTIATRIMVDEVERDIRNVENDIQIAKSDSVKFNNELNAIVSMDKVEDYVTNTLGMVKVQDYQVVYIDLSTDDCVVKADGKVTEDTPVINEKAE